MNPSPEVAALAQVLHGHGANILDSDRHSDSEAGVFAITPQNEHERAERELVDGNKAVASAR
jgi:formyltetrahydrofolate hydrolase